MVFKLFPRGNTFNDWFIFVGDFRVEFDIEPFLHWADDQESGAAIKHNTVGCRADEHLRPVGYLGQYLIKNQYQLFRPPLKQGVKAYAFAIMPKIHSGQIAFTFGTGPAH